MAVNDAVLPAPAGYIVNFAHPPQYGATTCYIITSIALTLAVATLGMRTYTRFVITRNAALEDYLIIFAFLSGLVTQSLILHLFIVRIAGVHAWELPLKSFNTNSLLTMIMSIMYVPCLGGAKLSILLLYRRLSPMRWFHNCIYVVMAIVAMYSIAIIFALIFPCVPIASNWDITIGGKCADKAKIYLATAGVNIATDMLIFILPLPMVWRLQMRKFQKVGLFAMFAFGSATCITSVVRLIYMIPMVKNFDATYAVSTPLIWVIVEANLVIIVACLPALRHFIRHFAPNFLGETTRSGAGGSSSKYGHGGTPPDRSSTGNKSLSQLTTRALRKSRLESSSYDLMTRSDEDIELTLSEKGGDDSTKDAASTVTTEALDKDATSGHIWTTKTFTVR